MPLSCPNRRPGERPGSGQGQRGAAGGFHCQLAATAAWEVAEKCWVRELLWQRKRTISLLKDKPLAEMEQRPPVGGDPARSQDVSAQVGGPGAGE